MNYQLPSNTFYEDFIIAEKFGIDAILDTAKRASREWIYDPYMFAALVIALNQRLWALYKTNEPVAKVYEKLYFEANSKAYNKYKGEDLDIYWNLTD